MSRLKQDIIKYLKDYRFYGFSILEDYIMEQSDTCVYFDLDSADDIDEDDLVDTIDDLQNDLLDYFDDIEDCRVWFTEDDDQYSIFVEWEEVEVSPIDECETYIRKSFDKKDIVSIHIEYDETSNTVHYVVNIFGYYKEAIEVAEIIYRELFTNYKGAKVIGKFLPGYETPEEFIFEFTLGSRKFLDTDDITDKSEYIYEIVSFTDYDKDDFLSLESAKEYVHNNMSNMVKEQCSSKYLTKHDSMEIEIRARLKGTTSDNDYIEADTITVEYLPLETAAKFLRENSGLVRTNTLKFLYEKAEKEFPNQYATERLEGLLSLATK